MKNFKFFAILLIMVLSFLSGAANTNIENSGIVNYHFETSDVAGGAVCQQVEVMPDFNLGAIIEEYHKVYSDTPANKNDTYNSNLFEQIRNTIKIRMTKILLLIDKYNLELIENVLDKLILADYSEIGYSKES
jgi:hypothetical protein